MTLCPCRIGKVGLRADLDPCPPIRLIGTGFSYLSAIPAIAFRCHLGVPSFSFFFFFISFGSAIQWLPQWTRRSPCGWTVIQVGTSFPSKCSYANKHSGHDVSIIYESEKIKYTRLTTQEFWPIYRMLSPFSLLHTIPR